MTRPERVVIITGAGDATLGAPALRRRSPRDRLLAGDGASYITGQVITVDGANSISEERGR